MCGRYREFNSCFAQQVLRIGNGKIKTVFLTIIVYDYAFSQDKFQFLHISLMLPTFPTNFRNKEGG